MINHLINYDMNINYFLVEETTQTIKITFRLNEKETDMLKEVLNIYYEMFSKLESPARYSQDNFAMKEVKNICEQDWNNYMKGIPEYSNLNGKFILEIDKSERPKHIKQSIIHTVTRIGEFYYLTDKEMAELTEDINQFIEAGDCCLFANNGPYGVIPLSKSLEEDIFDKEGSIKQYIQKNSHEPILEPSQIIEALSQIRKWMLERDLSKIPKWARGFIQINQEIKENCGKMKEDDFKDGIPADLIMTKRSGFCLNKEKWFREMCQRYHLPSWKNPEGSYLYGSKNYPFKNDYIKNMRGIKEWDMNCIYYSIGKGPWWKVRYVGQPPAHYQNLAEYGARIIKNSIKRHTKGRKDRKKDFLGRELEDISSINIYDNYKELKEMINGMVDGYAQDFSAYSDYLNRNSFDWIMKYLWGMPKWYRDIINHLMSLPVLINGKSYKYLHGSVMGIKLNFLLITFSNALMWTISNIITGTEDKAKFMGDDFLSVHNQREYTRKEKNIRYEVCSYFNCVINKSKTETLSDQGYVSFCKRYFNKEGYQITGLGGEYCLKMKPFLNDISVWENVCYHNDIPLRKDQVDAMAQLWSKYVVISYNKFHHSNDPDLGQMVTILRKIPFYYGGWSLEEADQELEAILLQSVISTVQVIFKDVYEDLSSNSLNRIRDFLRHEMDDYENNPYYINLQKASSYSEDYDRIKEFIDNIMIVMNQRSYSLDELQKARFSAQRLMEIVLQRDSKLSNSSSTKNRIAYKFDQDRVSKIRYGYFQESLTNRENLYRSSIIDNSVLKDSMSNEELSQSIRNYMKYVEAKNRSGSTAKTYWDAVGNAYIAMRVLRTDDDGTIHEMKKRLTSEDSYYQMARCRGGKWEGSFVWYEDLTEDEKLVYRYLRRSSAYKVIDHIERVLNKQIDSMKTYLLNRLTDLIE